jgi:hypothetical protein
MTPPPSPTVPTQQVVLRPRSLLEIGDLASGFVHAHALAFAKLLPICLLPSLMAAALLQTHTASVQTCWALVWLLGPISTAAATILCGELMLQPQASTRVVVRRWLGKLGRLTLVRIVDVFFKSLTGGIFLRWTVFFPEVVVLEGGGFDAVTRRSAGLLGVVSARWIGFACMALVAQAVGIWAGEVSWQALRYLFALPHQDSALLEHGGSWPALLGLGLAQTYLAAVRFLVYIDCRTRREGWDLAVQMAGLVQSARRDAAVRSVS